MDTNVRSIKDQLTDKNYVLNVANTMLKGMLFEQLPSIISKTLHAGLVLAHVEKDVNNIFKYANSPIQKMFYSAIFLEALRKDIFFINIMPPLHSATEQIEVVREGFRSSIEIWRKFQRQTGEMDMDSFLYYVNNMSGWPEDMSRLIQGGLELSIFEYCRTYLLSLQSTFKDFKVQEREVKTDLLIWSLAEPEFKIFVECNEIGQSSDNVSFFFENARDQLLQSKGYRVLRFSGQDILNYPLEVAEDLIGYLESHKHGIL